MDRTELLARISTASSPNDISSAIAGVRTWLADHPDDDEMHVVFQQLTTLDADRRAPAVGWA
jgi:hypothetical protein